MLGLKEKYRKYTDSLIRKGISPMVVINSDIIKLLTEDEEEYNFKINNIVGGPNGELIKINVKKNTVEIYNSFMDDFFSLRIYDLETGKIFPDGELYQETSHYDAITLFGYERYMYLYDQTKNDFSDCHREISRDEDIVNIKMLELINKLSRPKLPALKDNLLKVVSKYCKKNDSINKGIAKIIYDIDSAYQKHSMFKKFVSNELDNETIEIINRALYLIRLKEESEAYSKISIFPVIDIIKEYEAYNLPRTNKTVKKYIFISGKIEEILSTFSHFRVDIRDHLLNSDDIKSMSEKHRQLLLKKRNEIDNPNGGYYGQD